MSPQFTCAHANCQKTEVPIVLSMPGERSRFCCADHAAHAMVRRAWIASHGAKAGELQKIDKALFAIVGDGSDPKPENSR